MEEKPSFKEKIRYAVDNTFSRGTGALILWLAILSLVIIVVAGLVVSLLKIPVGDAGPVSFGEAAWESLMRTLDAGTMGGDTGWGFRIAMLFVTIGGVFVISTLIGVLTSGVESKLDDLRKGRSRVLENNQTIILGWSDQIFTIISELVAANENQPSSSIVILADKDKVEMEDEIHSRLESTGKTHIVCRTGSPIEISDLSLVSLNSSKSIIVLSPENSAEADAEVIKTILAIINFPNRREKPYHITAELKKAENGEVAKMVGKDEVEIIQTGEIIARIIAQTCRQSGLSVVYTELMDFGGDEIYTPELPELIGKTYGESLSAFAKNSVMGLIKKNSTAALNPPMDTRIENGDKVILIAADDDQIFLDGKPEIDEAVITQKEKKESAPERTIILGWNWRASRLLRELDNYVAPGSEAVVVGDIEHLEEKIAAVKPELKNQTISFVPGNISERKLLESLELEKFNHIILLCYSDDLPAQKADAQTLITLLHLRDMAEKKEHDFSIVSEMLDIRNRNLAEVAQADDFIVSDKLISLLLTQVSENKQLNSVFTDLFDPEGSEAYVNSAGQFVKLNVPVNFYTVVESARRQGKTAIGYRLASDAHNAEKAYGITLNPEKSLPITFSDHDKVILLAED
jgi:K+/H+ antiporter YhaU regulatory subunit KhtT